MSELKDWTKEPLGSARPYLKRRLAEALVEINEGTAPHLVDAQCGYIEAAIKAFRDNER